MSAADLEPSGGVSTRLEAALYPNVLTAVTVQAMLREADRELSAGKPTAETILRVLRPLNKAFWQGFGSISVTSPIDQKRVLLCQLWYQLIAALEEAEELERTQRAG